MVFLMTLVLAVTLSAESVKRVVRSEGVGDITVSCSESAGWSLSVSVMQECGREVVTVGLVSEAEAVPPSFDVFFYTSGADVLQVWTPFDERCQLWPFAWGNARYTSALAYRAPICAAFNNHDRNRCTVAVSDAFHQLKYALTVDERSCVMEGRFRFFTEKESPRKSYEVKILIDRRDAFWGDAVREASEWVSQTAGLVPAAVPEAAFDPLYSSWYAFWQDVHAPVIEKEARLAAELGMKTAILDDGWQKEKSRTYYSATGDWMPVKNRFPDMKAHVAAVHAAGLKYMLWLSVPYIGDESAIWNRFKDKCLSITPDGVGRLDPRFPEVREYLISTYERAVRDWGFDGLKLDFIDEFCLPPVDLAIAQDYAGRDIKSLPEAVDRLMKDVNRRLKAIRPDVLIEFRQQYMGPAIRQYGNMIRATDCPADLAANRRRVADLRLTSGTMAVHSDMLVWSADETPENAARAVLSALFGVVQYSMVLQKIPAAQREMMRHWIAFSQEHRDALLKGGFCPHHPEMQYPWIESWNDRERIVATYVENQVLPVPADGKTVYAINASQEPTLVLDIPEAPAFAEAFDTFGKSAGRRMLDKGLNRVAVPLSGYLKISPRVEWPLETLYRTPRAFPADAYKTNGVEVAFLEGLPYHGKPTKVFCYYGVPKHAAGEKVPGMVLVHGGGGSAFYRWVKFWNDRGYAAISMDTCGCVSGNTLGSEQRKHFRHADGGPAGWGGFGQTGAKIEDQWLYHAVADAILGHSFLRSLEGVDPDRIGVTGVSWGGVITSIVASQDGRFKFAAPVYGCGAFLENSPMWEKAVQQMGPEKTAEWKAIWDPIRYLAQAKIPVHWLAGTNDRAFSLPSLMDSFAAVPTDKSLAVKVRLVHTHGKPSEEATELTAWADFYCRGVPLPEPVKADLNYTKDSAAAWIDRKWETVPAKLVGGKPVADIPSGTTASYFNTFAADGFVQSTPVKEVK